MKIEWLILIPLFMALAQTFQSSAQQVETNQIADASAEFEAIKAKAEKGDTSAAGLLGRYYFAGVGVDKNEIEAVKWFRKAAEQGDAHAQYALGHLLLDGIGVQQNTVEATRWFQSGAKQGDAQSEFALGLCYAKGNGVSQNFVEAYKWYSVAAAQGLTNAISSQAGIAMFFMTPEQIAKGQKLAAEFKPTTTVPYTPYTANSQEQLDEIQAAKWYRIAADEGNTTAQLHLGAMYEKGEGVSQNYVEAYKWYSVAAAQGLTKAITSQAGIAKFSMTPEQIAKGQKLAAEFKPTTTVPYIPYSANLQKQLDDFDAWLNTPSGVNAMKTAMNGKGGEMGMSESAEIWNAWVKMQSGGKADTGETPSSHALAQAKRTYTPQQYRKMLLTTPFFGLPKDVQDDYIRQFRAGMEKDGFEISDAAIIQEYYKRQQMARPPPDVQQYYRTHREKQEPNKLDSRQMLLTTPFFDLPADVQDNCIRTSRAVMEKQGFQISDAEIIQEYYRRQEMALPPSYAQQNHGGQQEIPSQPNVGNSSTDSNPSATGTGFFITADGYLISNYHVVKDATKLRVLTSAGLIYAKVVQVDAANDLALLKTDGRFAPLPVAGSRTVALGGTVATVGFPDPGLQGFSPKLAKGEIASLSGAGDDPRYFQISVPVQPGNSGGALVDERGNVIGIVSAKLDAAVALAASGALPENVNYAVKSSLLLSFLEAVPDVDAKLKAPNTAHEKFEELVKSAQDAAVLVLIY